MLKKENSLRFKNNLVVKYKKENMALNINPKLPSFISPLPENGKITFANNKSKRQEKIKTKLEKRLTLPK